MTLIVNTSRVFSSGGSDPHFADVVLLCGFEGTDGATSISDESSAAHGGASFNNAAQISTAQAKFGGSSLKLVAGSSDYITWPDSADWALGTSQFTIEYFFYPTGIVGVQSMVSQWGASSKAWRSRMNNAFGGWGYTADGSTVIQPLSVAGITANAWQHLALDFDGTTYRMYLDGVRSTSSITSENIFDASAPLRIGGDDTDGNYFDGYIDEIRITAGVARYATNTSFTVPAAAFPRS